MEVIFNLFEHGANMFDAVGAIVFYIIALGRNNHIKNIWKFVFISAFFICVLGYFQDISDNVLIQFTNMVLIGLVFEGILLKGSMVTKVIYNMMYNIIIILTNMFTVYGIMIILDASIKELCTTGTILRIVVLVVNKTMILFMIMFLLFFLKRHQLEYQEWIIAFLLFAGTLSSGAILINITKSEHLDSGEEAGLMIIALEFFVISLGICVCIYKLNMQYNYKLDNYILNAKLKSEKDIIEKIEQMQEEDQILRHDLKHYLTVAQGMLHTDTVSEVSAYLDEVIGKSFEGKAVYCTNSSVINSVLNDKSCICTNNNIHYDVMVTGEIPKSIQIDVGIILSNLIDNAIDAENQEEVKKIRVELSRYKDMFLIKVENNISMSVLENNPFLVTDKKNKANHGWGMKSIRHLVKKLNGVYSYEERKNVFCVQILLTDIANNA